MSCKPTVDVLIIGSKLIRIDYIVTSWLCKIMIIFNNKFIHGVIGPADFR